MNGTMNNVLLARVQEAVNELGFYEPGTVADALRDRYAEYGRRKRRAFNAAVAQAYQVIEANGNAPPPRARKAARRDIEEVQILNSTSASSTCSTAADGENIDDYVYYPDTNLMNQSMSRMYDGGGPSTDPPMEVNGHGPPKTRKTRRRKDQDGDKGDQIDEAIKDRLSSDQRFTCEIPKKTLADVGGYTEQILEFCKTLLHLKQPELYTRLGVMAPTGVLLYGPPGSGKSLLVDAIAGELSIKRFRLAATELVSGVSGDSEAAIRRVFAAALAESPCLLFIDDIDAIAGRRDNAVRDMERRIVSQLLSSMDGVNGKVLVVGATCRPESLEPALRRAGRFDRELALGMPDVQSRADILRVLCRNLRVDSGFAVEPISRLVPGYVAADLKALVHDASVRAVERVLDACAETPTTTAAARLQKVLLWLREGIDLPQAEQSEIAVTARDFELAIPHIVASAQREGFATKPGVTWDDVGALGDVREQLKWAILYPIKCPDDFDAMGLSTRPQGLLLCGPPGCGKTLLAKAIANETGMNFISVKGPELLSMYVGESERAVRQLFSRAACSAPCVIFFDELDALCPRRKDHDSGGSARVVNQLLAEMDGLETRRNVFLIGATNRPDIIDPAVLRPGRFDRTVFVGFPNAADRTDILRAITQNATRPRFASELDLRTVATDERAEWMTGADLAALVREAAVAALRGCMDTRLATHGGGVLLEPPQIQRRHMEDAFAKVKPSVDAVERRRYETLKEKYANLPTA